MTLNEKKETLQKISPVFSNLHFPIIWFHCYSIGELEQAKPLIQFFSINYHGYKTLLSFETAAGYDAASRDSCGDVRCYLPPESALNALRFIEIIRPALSIWIRARNGFFFLNELKQKKIPVVSIDGVPVMDRFFSFWLGNLPQKMLNCFDHIFVQTELESKLLLKKINTASVSIAGDTRIDRVIEIAGKPLDIKNIAEFCLDKTVIVAGSTWEEDEEELDHYANTHPDIRFLIAPHQVNEERLKEIEKLFHNSIRYTTYQNTRNISLPANKTQPNVLIIDNIGLLVHLYRYATICYVGGGFGGDGVHSVLEAAVYGKPVIFGPVIEDDPEALELVETGGGIIVDSALEAESTIDRLLTNQNEYMVAAAAAKEYVFSKKGATDLITNYIQENLLLTS